VGLSSIEVTFDYHYPDTFDPVPEGLFGCLDKVIAIREQWLNPFISLAQYAGGTGSTPISSTDMILSAEFTSF
jgi:hypothetical protein